MERFMLAGLTWCLKTMWCTTARTKFEHTKRARFSYCTGRIQEPRSF